jgi:hypothetical protein
MKPADLARYVAAAYSLAAAATLLYVIIGGACYGMYDTALFVFGRWTFVAGIALAVLLLLNARTKPSPA